MFNITEYAMRRRQVVWFFLALMIFGGIYAFVKLGKREDSTFTIKTAGGTCPYPGATPEEVEQLVVEPLEREIRTMSSVYKITSESRFGAARVSVELLPSTPAGRTPQLWDELRRKVDNVVPRLPEGAGPVSVADDFGDVYGLYYALLADDGYSWSELRRYALDLQTRLYSVDGVQKVILYGEQTPVVNIYASISTLANFNIRPEQIASVMAEQNAVVAIGDRLAGQLEIEIVETGAYASVEDIADQLLMAADGKQYRLGDVARIERGYRQPATTMLRVDGRRAIGMAVATDPRLDVVAVGADIESVLHCEMNRIPLGIELVTLYAENRIAAEANNTFLVNLLESVAIVVLLIMLIMGARAGLLVGSSLLFAIGGTLLLMLLGGEGLNRTSLAGFIIAMGMLVDNAIVVTDNARMLMRGGMSAHDALLAGATAPRWGLLGATLIAVISFFTLYLAPSSVAEIVKHLFVVIAVSLMLSWLLALTQVPMMG
ncbi:MAG: efflux RND transporter permease subunit, partial [Alistipes sp.]|nr:efflux RND transporter permease subunit [Alistipes sp.]